MINKEQKYKLVLLIELYSHCVSRFDSTPNQYSKEQVSNAYEELNDFIDGITNDD